MSRPNSVTDSPAMLIEGQRLDQTTFHALYEAMPPGTRAELVGGSEGRNLARTEGEVPTAS